MKRLTSAKRMRVSVSHIPIRRAQLHRLRDPIRMSDQWRRRVIQGYFNYQAGRGYTHCGIVVSLDEYLGRGSANWTIATSRGLR